MTTPINDEILAAYVDGELGDAAARDVELAIERDPELAETVRALRESSAALRAAFAGPLHEEVPGHLTDAVNAGFAKRRASTRGDWYRRPALAAMAASILVLAVGLGGAFVFFERQVETRLARLEAAQATDRALIHSAIATALEKNVSGVPAAWHNPESGSRGQVAPVRTFRSVGGQWCREYVLEANLKSGVAEREVRRAIACRDPRGRWKTRVEMTSGS